MLQVARAAGITLPALCLSLFVANAADQPARKDFTAQQRRYWAFQPLTKPTPPELRSQTAGRNEIDTFILAKLESKKLQPNPRAGKMTLLRRATLDLIGLPPSPEEIQAFLADDSPDAFARVVDRIARASRAMRPDRTCGAIATT